MDSTPELSVVLEPAEEEVLTLLQQRLEGQGGTEAEEGAQHLTAGIHRLHKVWQALEAHPSILRGQTLGARHRDLRSLVDTLALSGPYTVEVFLPTRASLCRAFLQAKLNFCRLVSLVSTEILEGDDEGDPLARKVERIRTSAVCNVMAEDLLRMICSDESLPGKIRRRATRVLVQMWEDRACQVVPRLFPVIDSVWQAKAHVTISYGTLSGASEILSMLSEGCEQTFVDCFSRDSVTEDEVLGLQEFVFNVSYEQIVRIQRHMEDFGPLTVDAEMVASILQIPVSQLRVQTCTCEDMIFTFREREAMAAHRRAFNIAGPKRTAEQVLMTYMLEQARDDEIEGCDTPGGRLPEGESSRRP